MADTLSEQNRLFLLNQKEKIFRSKEDQINLLLVELQDETEKLVLDNAQAFLVEELKETKSKKEALEYALNHRISEIRREARSSVLDELEEWVDTEISHFNGINWDRYWEAMRFKNMLCGMREVKDEPHTKNDR